MIRNARPVPPAPFSGSAQIGPVGAGVLVAGNMIGSGIYLLPATLAAIGSVSLIGWLIALVGAMSLAVTCSLLAMTYPKEPGINAYINLALGGVIGFVATYIYWLSVLLGNAAIAIVAAGYLLHTIPADDPGVGAMTLAAMVIVILAAVVNRRGARLVTKLGGAALVVGLAPIVLFATLGWLQFDPTMFRRSWNMTDASTMSAVAIALPSIAWAFLGVESAGVAAEAVRGPRRNILWGTLGGVAGAGVIYMLLCTVIFGLAPASSLALSSAPLADLAGAHWGAWLGVVVAACAAVKASGTIIGWTFLGAETASAAVQVGFFPRLARDGRHTSLYYLIFGTLCVIVGIILSMSKTIGEQFGLLINSTTVLCLIVYACCGASLVRVRSSFRSGWLRSGAVLAGATSVMMSVALIVSCGAPLIAFAAVVIASGVVLERMRTAWRPRASV